VNRITVNPAQMGGVPCIRGMRIPVATVAGLIADGFSTADVLRELPYLDAEDVKAVLEHVSHSANNSEFEVVLGSEGIACESR
jgi:uncharacterized protein (DUF433 family)